MIYWSLKSCFWTALAIIVLSAVVVILLMHKAVWLELETLAVIIGFMMSIFYTYILYHGVMFLDDETITFPKTFVNPLDFADGGDSFGHITAAGASEGLIGLLLGIVIDIFVCFFLAVVLCFLLWLGVNLIVGSIIAIAIPLFYIFKRSLMFVVRHVSECRGNLSKSLQYGLAYALLKTGTLCLMVFVSHELANIIKALFLGTL